jgi:(p)ppGpp synthase/HD superfamily hydrolase
MTEVQQRHRKQLSTMRGWLDGAKFYVALDALEVCRKIEQGTRKDGETPKFHHQLSVARLLTTLVPHLMHPEATIATAFLHDMMEDHEEWTFDAVEQRFGNQIAEAVWAMSKKTPGLKKEPGKYFGDLSENPIASVVKLADRNHNLQTMQGVFTYEKQKAYIQEVEDWFYPMAKIARRAFPSQYPAYENLKILLRCQTRLIRHIHLAAEAT